MEGKCLESARASNRVSLSYRRSPFLVLKSKFAVRSQRIPCYDAQGIYPQLSDIASYSNIGFISEGPKATKFPVLFPVSREFRPTETGLAGLRPPPGSPRVWHDFLPPQNSTTFP
jgi:hypothetical protein